MNPKIATIIAIDPCFITENIVIMEKIALANNNQGRY